MSKGRRFQLESANAREHERTSAHVYFCSSLRTFAGNVSEVASTDELFDAALERRKRRYEQDDDAGTSAKKLATEPPELIDLSSGSSGGSDHEEFGDEDDDVPQLEESGEWPMKSGGALLTNGREKPEPVVYDLSSDDDDGR